MITGNYYAMQIKGAILSDDKATIIGYKRRL